MGARYSERKWEKANDGKLVACVQNTERSKSWKHPKAKKSKREKKSLGMLKINNVRQLFRCYSNLFKCYWRVSVPSELAAVLMFEKRCQLAQLWGRCPHPLHPQTRTPLPLLRPRSDEKSGRTESGNMWDGRWEERERACEKKGHAWEKQSSEGISPEMKRACD